MRLVTFNIRTSAAIKDALHHWHFRREAVLHTIDQMHGDIVCLQEARQKPLEFVTEHLSGFERVAAGRKDGKTKGEALPVFVGPGYKLDAHEIRWFSDTPDVPGSKFADVSIPRIATIAHITELASNTKFTVMNIHLDTAFRSIRERSMQMVQEWAKAESLPCIVVGDFNCTTDAPEMEPLLKHGWTDALGSLATSGEGVATWHGFNHHTDGQRIDHILIPSELEVESGYIENKIVGKVPSDHWPVVVDVKL